MTWKFRKRETIPTMLSLTPTTPAVPPAELTGIEKMQAEETARLREAEQQRERERKQVVVARIAALRAEIAPQLEEIAQLERALNPQTEVYQADVQGALQAGYAYGLDRLSGGCAKYAYGLDRWTNQKPWVASYGYSGSVRGTSEINLSNYLESLF